MSTLVATARAAVNHGGRLSGCPIPLSWLACALILMQMGTTEHNDKCRSIDAEDDRLRARRRRVSSFIPRVTGAR